jgi:CheY-like chemotaxis protein
MAFMSNAPSVSQRSALEGTRILVAEDEVVTAMMLEDVLIDAGALVLGPVISVQDALRMVDVALGDGGISVAVLDIRLGKGNAIRIADVLRERGVPYLFATGDDGNPALESHRDVPVLSKPFVSEDLVTAIERLCRSRA